MRSVKASLLAWVMAYEIDFAQDNLKYGICDSKKIRHKAIK